MRPSQKSAHFDDASEMFIRKCSAKKKKKKNLTSNSIFNVGNENNCFQFIFRIATESHNAFLHLLFWFFHSLSFSFSSFSALVGHWNLLHFKSTEHRWTWFVHEDWEHKKQFFILSPSAKQETIDRQKNTLRTYKRWRKEHWSDNPGEKKYAKCHWERSAMSTKAQKMRREPFLLFSLSFCQSLSSVQTKFVVFG